MTTRRGRFLAAACLVVGLAADRTSFAAEKGITQAQANAILEELKQIHVLLEKNLQPRPVQPANPAPPQRVRVPPGRAAIEIGKPDAPITLVEFTDYQCPYCRQFHISTYEQLKKNYVDTGKLRYVSWDLPLDFHKFAFAAASAARCAGAQGKFWDLRHVMIVNDQALEADAVRTYARDLGLDMPRFEACVAGETYGSEIRQEISDARAIGVSATPSFVLGRTSKQGTEGILIVGAPSYAEFQAQIDELLGAKP